MIDEKFMVQPFPAWRDGEWSISDLTPMQVSTIPHSSLLNLHPFSESVTLDIPIFVESLVVMTCDRIKILEVAVSAPQSSEEMAPRGMILEPDSEIEKVRLSFALTTITDDIE